MQIRSLQDLARAKITWVCTSGSTRYEEGYTDEPLRLPSFLGTTFADEGYVKKARDRFNAVVHAKAPHYQDRKRALPFLQLLSNRLDTLDFLLSQNALRLEANKIAHPEPVRSVHVEAIQSLPHGKWRKHMTEAYRFVWLEDCPV